MHASLRERKSEGGFTLIELLVVMIIIAILMAVAVPTFLSQKSNGLKTQTTSNITQIKSAIESCAAQNTDGTYTGCVTLGAAGATAAGTLRSFERGLVNLPVGSATAVGYTVGATNQGGANTGFYVTGSVRDGQQNIWFGYAQYGDGTVIKRCGAGTMVAPNLTDPASSGWGGTAVANSRICSRASATAQW